MSWLTVLWSMCAGICVMLGLLHFLLWVRNRSFKYLLSATMAISAGACALLELSMLQSSFIPNYQLLLQYQNLFVYILLISTVWLVYFQMNTARRGIAYVITVMWSIGLVINFVTPGSLVYERIDELKQKTVFWGEPFTVATGVENPWVWLVNIATLLILIYVIDASIRSWRFGDKRSAAVIGGGIVTFLLFGLVHSIMVDTGTIESPYMVSFAYLAMVLAMSYELVSDAVRVPQLTLEIQANEKRWRDLLENVQLAVIGIDPHGLINYTNSFFQDLTGYQKEKLNQRPILDLTPVSDRSQLKQYLKDAEQTGPKPHSQWTIICASGEQRHIALSVVKQQNSDGGYAGILTVGADITDRLSAQRELQQTQSELERLTRASMLGEVASALAHELNQPLAAILSNSQAALRFMESDNISLQELREILEDIVRDDKRAGEVIHSLRSMLYKGEIQRELISIENTINEVVTLLRGELETMLVDLRVYINPDFPKVSAGRVEIQQVIMNLLLNAIHAVEKKPDKQRVITINGESKNNLISISIQDSGSGIAPADLSKVFNPFYTNRKEGIGMGLAICKRIIESHGGKIWAANSPNGGAIFTFELPMGS